MAYEPDALGKALEDLTKAYYTIVEKIKTDTVEAFNGEILSKISEAVKEFIANNFDEQKKAIQEAVDTAKTGVETAGADYTAWLEAQKKENEAKKAALLAKIEKEIEALIQTHIPELKQSVKKSADGAKSEIEKTKSEYSTWVNDQIASGLVDMNAISESILSKVQKDLKGWVTEQIKASTPDTAAIVKSAKEATSSELKPWVTEQIKASTPDTAASNNNSYQGLKPLYANAKIFWDGSMPFEASKPPFDCISAVGGASIQPYPSVPKACKLAGAGLDGTWLNSKQSKYIVFKIKPLAAKKQAFFLRLYSPGEDAALAAWICDPVSKTPKNSIGIAAAATASNPNGAGRASTCLGPTNSCASDWISEWVSWSFELRNKEDVDSDGFLYFAVAGIDTLFCGWAIAERLTDVLYSTASFFRNMFFHEKAYSVVYKPNYGVQEFCIGRNTTLNGVRIPYKESAGGIAVAFLIEGVDLHIAFNVFCSTGEALAATVIPPAQFTQPVWLPIPAMFVFFEIKKELLDKNTIATGYAKAVVLDIKTLEIGVYGVLKIQGIATFPIEEA